MKIKKEDKEKIPNGIYCYSYDENGKYKTCPFWNLIEEGVGECKLLKISDKKETISLFDQVKECNINDDFNEEEYI